MKMLAVAAVLVLAGCTASPPDAFTESPVQVSCGTFDLGLVGTLPEDAATCLHREVGTRSAELVLTRLTDEGDPITSYFRTSADDNGITVYIDATQDSFGSRTWETYHCPADLPR
jgi:hypothetical protein